MFTVYFLKSLRNNKIYIGMTSKEVDERLSEHNNGSNKFTRSNKPFTLIYFERYRCSEDARIREKFYKSGFGRNIRDLIVKYTEDKDL